MEKPLEDKSQCTAEWGTTGTFSFNSENTKKAIEKLLNAYGIPYKISEYGSITFCPSKANWNLKSEKDFSHQANSLAHKIVKVDDFIGMNDVLFLPKGYDFPYTPSPKQKSKSTMDNFNTKFTMKNVKRGASSYKKGADDNKVMDPFSQNEGMYISSAHNMNEAVFGIPTRKDKGYVEYENIDEFGKLNKVLEKYDIKYTVDSDNYSRSSGYSGTLHFVPMKSEKVKADPQAFSNDLKQVILTIGGDYNLPKGFDLPYKPDPKQTSRDTIKTFDKKFNTDYIGVLPGTDPFSKNESKIKKSELKEMIKETYNKLLKEEDAEQILYHLDLKDVQEKEITDKRAIYTTTSDPEYVKNQLQSSPSKYITGPEWKHYYKSYNVLNAGGGLTQIVFHKFPPGEMSDVDFDREQNVQAQYRDEVNENNKTTMKKSQLRKIVREAINSMGIEPLGYYTDQGEKTEENPEDMEHWLKQIEGMSLDAATRHLGIKGLPSSMTDKILQHHNTDIVDTFDEFSDEENPFPSNRKSIDQLDKDDLYEGIGPVAGVMLLGLTAAVLGGVAANVGGSLDSLTKYIHTGGPGKAAENLKQASKSSWSGFLRKLPFIGSKLKKQDEENRLKAEIGAALQEFIKTGEGVEFIKSLMEDPEGKAILTRISNGSSNYTQLYNIVKKYLNAMMFGKGKWAGNSEWNKVKNKFFALRKDVKGGKYKDTITPPDNFDYESIFKDDGMEESIDREFHSTKATSGHPKWSDLSAEEIQDYIDANPDTLWGRSLSTAKMVMKQKQGSANENIMKKSELKNIIKEAYLEEISSTEANAQFMEMVEHQKQILNILKELKNGADLDAAVGEINKEVKKTLTKVQNLKQIKSLKEEDEEDIEDVEDGFEAEPAVAQDGESKNQESAPRKRINFENRELEMLVDVNRNKTKKGIKIQFLSDEELSKEERTKLVSSLQTYLDEGLAKFVKGAKLNVDSDQDVPNKNKTVGFTIKIGDVFGLVSKVFSNRGDDEEGGEEVEADETETEETEELHELRQRIRGFLKEDQFVGRNGELFEIDPEDFSSALEHALVALDLEEVGDIKDKKTLSKVVSAVLRSVYIPGLSPTVKQFSGLSPNQQLTILQKAEMYI